MAFFVLTLSITVSLFPASYTDDFAFVALMVMIKVVIMSWSFLLSSMTSGYKQYNQHKI